MSVAWPLDCQGQDGAVTRGEKMLLELMMACGCQ
jgi:hypothetical protein